MINYRVDLSTRMNTDGADKDYQAFKVKIEKHPLNIKFKVDSSGLENISKAIDRISTKQQQLSANEKIFNNWSKNLRVVQTETNKWKDAQNALHTIITKTTEDGNVYQTRLKQTADELGTITTETQNYIRVAGQLQKAGDAYKEIEQGTDRANKALKELKNTEEEVSNASEKASRHTQSLAERLVTAAGKVALFKVSTTIVMAFYNAIGDAKDRVIEYDKALTELKKVWDDSYGSLDRLSKKLSEIGKETANTLTNMTNIATGIVKAGYNNERDIAIMAEYVAKLQNTADEELTAAEATSILVSQLKAYHMEASEASRVTDILNAVSAKQAVSSGDLSKALTVGSSSMATYGNTIEQTTALITAGTTVMQNRSQQVSRG